MRPIELCSNDIRLLPQHEIGGLQSQLHGHVWDYYYLFDCETREFLHNGVMYGFDIVDVDAYLPNYQCSNYFSVCSGPAHDYVHGLNMQEIAEGK